ncbi:MAG: alpha/beta hydrolase, partial [Desulfobacterales bacterium]
MQVERAAVIGLSAGGPAALQFALCYPDRCMGLVMLSAISHRFTEIPWIFKALYFGLMKINFLPWLLFQRAASEIGTSGSRRPAHAWVNAVNCAANTSLRCAVQFSSCDFP